MNCKEVQELLPADYLDRRLDQQSFSQLREHLKVCPACRQLEEQLQVQRSIFKQAKQQEVPAGVWQNIRDTIIAERLDQQEALAAGVLGRLRKIIFSPKPVFALATAMAVFILVFIFGRQAAYKNQPIENLNDYRLNSGSEEQIYDLKTSLEEYFL